MDKKIKELYQSVILTHDKSPYHYEKMDSDEFIRVEAYNPMCGDQFDLFLKLDGQTVVEAYFFGYGCAISKASTSILTRQIEGKPLVVIQEWMKKYLDFVLEENDVAEILSDDLLAAFAGTRQYPSRKPCATLAWEALLQHLASGV